MAVQTPVVVLGSGLTGSGGASDRTYDITVNSGETATILSITVQGFPLTLGASYDYTFATPTITFKNAVDNSDIIQVVYDITTSATTTSAGLKYSNIEDFNDSLALSSRIPARDSSSYPTREDIGTGNGSTSIFYLSKGGYIRDTLTLYTGGATSVESTTLLTETTHYTIGNTEGKVTLTGTGVTLVSTNHLFAQYKHNREGTEDDRIQDALLRAEAEMDNMVNTVFYDGTEATPDFVEIRDELYQGQGNINRVYQTQYYPLNSTTTTLNGAVSADDATITVTSTNGFPSTGYFAVEDDKITYTGKTTTTFTGCTGAAAHDDGKTVTSYVIERSIEGEGTAPSWEVQQPDTDYSIDFDTGEIKLVNDSLLPGTVYNFMQPPRSVWDRVRLSYQYGYDTIPTDMVRCVYLIAGKELYSGQVLNALSRGSDGFESDGITSVDAWITKTVNKYKCWLVKNINT